MAGRRFVFQELASGASRSTSRLVGAQGSASSRTTAPVIITRASEDGTRTLSNVFHGAAIHPGTGTALPSSSRGLHARAGGGIGTHINLFRGATVHPGMVVPNNREILSGSENGIRTLSNVFHGAAIHPGTALPSSSHGLHGRVARCTGQSTNGMPSSITDYKDLLHKQNMKIMKLQNEFEITKAEMEMLRINMETEVIKGQTTMFKYFIFFLGLVGFGPLLADWVAS